MFYRDTQTLSTDRVATRHATVTNLHISDINFSLKCSPAFHDLAECWVSPDFLAQSTHVQISSLTPLPPQDRLY